MSSNKKFLGIIFSNMHDNCITDLTKNRTMGSVLFGGRYRLIDFPISNMVNSGVDEVGVITKSNYQSLLDHLGSGREWDLSRKRGGLHLLPPFSNNSSGMYRGRLEALYGIYDFINGSDADYVVMSDCDVVTNLNIENIINRHIDTKADITIVYARDVLQLEQAQHSTVLGVDEDERVYDVLLRPQLSGACNVSLNMYVIGREFLKNIILETASRSLFSFEQDIIQARRNEYKIMGYKHNGYYSKITSMDTYFKANMSLLNTENRNKLFVNDTPIYTKVRDNPPAKFGIGASVKNSLIADGCIIDGTVENSILFRGVRVGKGACVRNSIIMQNASIGKKSDVNYIITDKNVVINEFKILTGSQNHQLFIGKNVVI